MRTLIAILVSVTALAASCSSSKGPELLFPTNPVGVPDRRLEPANELDDHVDRISRFATNKEKTEQTETTPEASPDDSTKMKPVCTAPLKGDPVSQQTTFTDFDGDGRADLVTIYLVKQSTTSDEWRIRVDTAAGESLDSQLSVEVGSAVGAAPLGGTDIDGDGANQELFSAIGTGASVVIVVIHTRDGCDIVQTSVDNTPVTFPVGGSVGNVAGIECRDNDKNGLNDTVVAWTGEADFNPPSGDYILKGVEYRLVGSLLVQVDTLTTTANIAEADFIYSQLSCGAVNL